MEEVGGPETHLVGIVVAALRFSVTFDPWPTQPLKMIWREVLTSAIAVYMAALDCTTMTTSPAEAVYVEHS